MCWVIGSAAFKCRKVETIFQGFQENFEFVFSLRFLKNNAQYTLFFFSFLYFFLNYSLESNNVFKNNFLKKIFKNENKKMKLYFRVSKMCPVAKTCLVLQYEKAKTMRMCSAKTCFVSF